MIASLAWVGMVFTTLVAAPNSAPAGGPSSAPASCPDDIWRGVTVTFAAAADPKGQAVSLADLRRSEDPRSRQIAAVFETETARLAGQDLRTFLSALVRPVQSSINRSGRIEQITTPWRSYRFDPEGDALFDCQIAALRASLRFEVAWFMARPPADRKEAQIVRDQVETLLPAVRQELANIGMGEAKISETIGLLRKTAVVMTDPLTYGFVSHPLSDERLTELRTTLVRWVQDSPTSKPADPRRPEPLENQLLGLVRVAFVGALNPLRDPESEIGKLHLAELKAGGRCRDMERNLREAGGNGLPRGERSTRPASNESPAVR